MQVERDPDAGWVRDLGGTPMASVRAALREAEDQRQLFNHLDREHRAGGRSSYIEIDAPLELFALARLLQPEHVVEVGVSSGVSSAYLLRALELNGRGTLHSVDLPSRPHRSRRASSPSWTIPEGRSSGWAVPFRLRARWDLRLGDKATVIPLLSGELPRVDLLLYDVPHDEADLVREFACLDRRMRPGTVAIVDHGPSGGLCRALAGWARRRHTQALRREGLGLYGIRVGRPYGAIRAGAPPRPRGP
jgi:Methyltransferase domain